jgi:hypothetical protein
MKSSMIQPLVTSLLVAAVASAERPQISLSLGWSDWPFTIGFCEQPNVEIRARESHSPDGAWSSTGDCVLQQRVHTVSWAEHSVTVTETKYDVLSRSLDPCAWSAVPGSRSDCKVFHQLGFGNAILCSDVPVWVAAFSPVEDGGWGPVPRTEWFFSFSGPESLAAEGIRFTACAEDLDASGDIDFGDLSLLFILWGDSWAGRPDLDGSELVDGSDLSLMLMSFGPCEW